MATGNGVVIRFLADTGSAIRDIGRLERATGKSMGALGKAATVARKSIGPALIGLGAAAAGAAAFTFEAAKAALEDQAAQAKLARAMKNTTKATKADVEAMEDYVTVAQKKTGMDDGELREGLALLLRQTKDTTRAQALSNVAMKISLATGKDYMTVVKALARAEDGQTMSLKRLGVAVGDNAQNYADLVTANREYAKAQDKANQALAEYGPKSDEYAKALGKVKDAADKIDRIKGSGVKWLAEVNDQFKGSIADDAKTYAGGVRRVATAWSELQEAFGAGVVGGGDGGAELMGDLADAMYDAAPAAEIAGEAIGNFVEGLVRDLPVLLATLKEIQLGVGSFTDNLLMVPLEVGDFLGIIPDEVTDAPRKALQARDQARRAELQAFMDSLYNPPVSNPYAEYRPMRATQRQIEAKKTADARASQREARTRQAR